MRKSLIHFIGKVTKFTADFTKSLKDGVTIDRGVWSLDREQKMIAAQSVVDGKAMVEIKDGEPGCQYVLIFDGKATDGTPLHAEYWLNTRREESKTSVPIEPEISVGPITDE